MAAQDNLSSTAENGSFNSNGQLNPESNSNWSEDVIKVRKPYVVTKQREKWSEEEHERFIEAISLYGGGWRQIQEHIGTKTAVQIRSHAQKFFSKVAKEVENGSVKTVVIPPPRPKRKPSHPYPRNSVLYSSSSAMEKGGVKSPTSVLSVFTSEDQVNRCSPNSCTSDIQSIDKATSKPSFKGECITLFGKVVLVVDESIKFEGNEKSSTLQTDSRLVDTDLSLGVWEPSCNGSNVFGSVTETSENLEKNAQTLKRLSPANANGFRPYKRCLSEREVTSSLSSVASEEERSQRRARVCS